MSLRHCWIIVWVIIHHTIENCTSYNQVCAANLCCSKNIISHLGKWKMWLHCTLKFVHFFINKLIKNNQKIMQKRIICLCVWSIFSYGCDSTLLVKLYKMALLNRGLCLCIGRHIFKLWSFSSSLDPRLELNDAVHVRSTCTEWIAGWAARQNGFWLSTKNCWLISYWCCRYASEQQKILGCRAI